MGETHPLQNIFRIILRDIMPFINELIISVAGGVLTALILGLFSGRRKNTPVTQINTQTQNYRENKGPSIFGQFIHLTLAVLGGLGLSFFASRFLFKSGILERGLPMRLVILIASTIFVWWVLLLFRGKR